MTGIIKIVELIDVCKKHCHAKHSELEALKRDCVDKKFNKHNIHKALRCVVSHDVIRKALLDCLVPHLDLLAKNDDYMTLKEIIKKAEELGISKDKVARSKESLANIERSTRLQVRCEELGLGSIQYPSDMCCPITLCQMVDPVVASDGHSYERRAIMAVISGDKKSPLTRESLASTVFPNRTLLKRIQVYREEQIACAETALAHAGSLSVVGVKRKR